MSIRVSLSLTLSLSLAALFMMCCISASLFPVNLTFTLHWDSRPIVYRFQVLFLWNDSMNQIKRQKEIDWGFEREMIMRSSTDEPWVFFRWQNECLRLLEVVSWNPFAILHRLCPILQAFHCIPSLFWKTHCSIKTLVFSWFQKPQKQRSREECLDRNLQDQETNNCSFMHTKTVRLYLREDLQSSSVLHKSYCPRGLLSTCDCVCWFRTPKKVEERKFSKNM
jgi:hypothetical protein